ncbi:MAG: hypothetical protein GY926_09665 [bacterium]|nr:hypothetical protein [bacterium]
METSLLAEPVATATLDKESSDAHPASSQSQPRRSVPQSRSSRPWKRIIIDSALLATFILGFASLALGNILWHVVAGLAFAVLAVAHVAINRTWARGVARRRRTLRGHTRTNAAIASTLAVGWLAIVISGIGLWAGVGSFEPLHSVGVILLTVSTVVHLVMHRRWIKRAAPGRPATDRVRGIRANVA